MQSRLKSKVVWTSTATLIIFVLKNYFNFELPKYNELLDLILILATALGVFNNPCDSEKF